MCAITYLLFTAMLAVDLPDDVSDPRFGHFVGVEINACAVDASTDTIFVGGNFSAWERPDSSVVTRGNLIAFGPDGRILDWAPSTNGQVLGMELVGNTLYLFGYFTEVNGAHRNRVAAVSATSGVLLPFDAGIVGDAVWDGVVSGGILYLGGSFVSAGGVPRENLAAVDAVSGALRSWNPGANSVVYALAAAGSSIYAVGTFSVFGGQGRGHGGAMTSGGSLLPWDPQTDLLIRDVAVVAAGVVIGGEFGVVKGTTRSRLALVDAVTGDDAGWDLPCSGNIGDLAVSSNGLYVGGQFDAIAGMTRHGAALVTGTGSLAAWAPTSSEGDGYYAIAAGPRGVYGGAGAFYPYSRPVSPRVNRVAATWQGETFDVADLALTGKYFYANSADLPEVVLSGPATLAVTGVTVLDEQRLTGTVDFSGAPLGTYALTLTNPDGRSVTLARAVTLSQASVGSGVRIVGWNGSGGSGGCGSGVGLSGLAGLGLLLAAALRTTSGFRSFNPSQDQKNEKS